MDDSWSQCSVAVISDAQAKSHTLILGVPIKWGGERGCFSPRTCPGRWNPIFASPRVNAEDAKNEKELWAMVFEKVGLG